MENLAITLTFAINLSIFAFLAYHFDKWWIVLFAVLFVYGSSKKENDNQNT
jgi:predicted secreted protein